MNLADFKRVLTAFADSPADVDIGKGRLLVQIRNDLIEAQIEWRDGELFVQENGATDLASRWIINRVAHLPLLADRILTQIEPLPYFVPSTGRLLDQIDRDPDDRQPVVDAETCVREVLSRRPGFTSTVLYLTSDAGEGKTTLINQVARAQAASYKDKRTDWLLVPISLAGRPFLRFDDVVIAALVNRLRFPFLYFDAFVELVRLGVVVPAFDGFEEMFVETSTGEALSALGGLVRSFESAGSVLIAARKAYFEYRSFATQAKLFDALGEYAVSFARLALQRWTRQQFLDYASKRNFTHAMQLYDAVSSRLGDDHPVLTRAVLVKRLFDVAGSTQSLDSLLVKFGQTPQDYFYQFVNAIIDREVQEKWIDRSGDPARPLLNSAEHRDLLALVAQEMWIMGADVLKGELFDMVSDLFAESRNKPPVVARQIRERLKQHSLITSGDASRTTFGFDHEDFRQFFLGESLGQALVASSTNELSRLLRVGTLPGNACDAAALMATRASSQPTELTEKLQTISDADVASSFTRENCGALLIRLVDGTTSRPTLVRDMTFPPDALRGRHLRNLQFLRCYFQASSLEHSNFADVTFISCTFDGLEMATSAAFTNVELRESLVRTVHDAMGDSRIFDPAGLRRVLTGAGWRLGGGGLERSPVSEPHESDAETQLTERALRTFRRATHANDSLLRTRLGVKSNQFFSDVLPRLLDCGILEEVQYLGSGQQRRYRLAMPMQQVEAAIEQSKGSFTALLEVCQTTR